ncbi:MAG: hypothetical protein HYY23_03055, partial [Verrucomicrobia bacterium]|nr:hypothetical protein [Verrucomicrobiota bacterium]
MKTKKSKTLNPSIGDGWSRREITFTNSKGAASGPFLSVPSVASCSTALLLSLITLALLALPSRAAVPDRTITVSLAAPSATWAPVLPAVGANVLYNPKTGEPCGKTPADYCDITLLHVDAAPSYWQNKIGGVLLSLFNSDGANFDVYVYQSDANANRGPLVGSANHRRLGQPQVNWLQESTGILRASGYYLIQVVYTDAPGSTFVAHAEFISPSQWTPYIGALALGMYDQLLDEPPGDLFPSRLQYKDYTGLIDSFDGLTLSTRIRIPFNATKPLPTVLVMGGFPRSRGGPDADILGPVGTLVEKGYVAVSYAMRGYAGSCAAFELPPPVGTSGFETPRGPGDDPLTQVSCVRGWMHIYERDFETRDSQRVLGVLVDYGIADPDRLAAAGTSGGGGESWLLATSQPWDSTTLSPWGSSTPAGTKLQLAAAIPIIGWTDMLNSLAPNGRANDDLGQGRSHETPHGILKQSYAANLVSGALAFGARFNTVEPTELHSFGFGWLAFWDAGEPYETSSVGGITANNLAAALRGKSAYYAQEYFDAIKAGAIRPVPIFAIQGWTDTLFPAVELLQMYRQLKAADANYPIWMVLADYGHPNAQHPNTANFEGVDRVQQYILGQANDFLDAHLLGTRALPADRVVSIATEPIPLELKLQGQVPPLPQVAAGRDWDELHPGMLGLAGDDRPRTTASGPPNAAEETITDPLLAQQNSITQLLSTYDDADDWKWQVPEGGFTLLALPTLRINHVIEGSDATVIAK